MILDYISSLNVYFMSSNVNVNVQNLPNILWIFLIGVSESRLIDWMPDFTLDLFCHFPNLLTVPLMPRPEFNGSALHTNQNQRLGFLKLFPFQTSFSELNYIEMKRFCSNQHIVVTSP